MATLGIGYTFNPDGYAINDFEGLTPGVVTNLNFGVQTNGGLSWGDSILITLGS